jgi:inner membrane transporter RhtA
MLVLEEFLTAWQWLALACVVAASVGATRSGAVLAEPVPD